MCSVQYLRSTELYLIQHFRVYSRVPQIFPWRANLLQSLAPTLIKLTYLWFSNLEDSDYTQLCLIRVRAKLCRSGPDLRMPGVQYSFVFIHLFWWQKINDSMTLMKEGKKDSQDLSIVINIYKSIVGCIYNCIY